MCITVTVLETRNPGAVPGAIEGQEEASSPSLVALVALCPPPGLAEEIVAARAPPASVLDSFLLWEGPLIFCWYFLSPACAL